MKELLKEEHVFLFQGVGAEYQSLLHLLDNKQRSILNDHCLIVSKQIGLDLQDYLNNSTTHGFSRVLCDWISIYTVDYIVYSKYTEAGLRPGIFLGYSMGLITALACGKAISFEAGLDMLCCIFKYLESTPRQETMAAIVGISLGDVEKIIHTNNLKDFVEIASENNEYCIVISGIKNEVYKTLEIAAREGALKVRDINIPFACHSHYAANKIESFEEFVSKLEIVSSEIPIISNYTQDIIQKPSDLKDELLKNMTGRMYWRTAIEKLVDMDFNCFVEVSLSDSITKFSKLINTDCEFITYKKYFKVKSKQ